MFDRLFYWFASLMVSGIGTFEQNGQYKEAEGLLVAFYAILGVPPVVLAESKGYRRF